MLNWLQNPQCARGEEEKGTSGVVSCIHARAACVCVCVCECFVCVCVGVCVCSCKVVNSYRFKYHFGFYWFDEMNRRLQVHFNFHVHWYSSIHHEHYPLAAGFSSSVTHGLWILPWNKLSKCSDTEWVSSWIVSACQWHRVISGQRIGAISNHAFISDGVVTHSVFLSHHAVFLSHYAVFLSHSSVFLSHHSVFLPQLHVWTLIYLHLFTGSISTLMNQMWKMWTARE